MPTSSESARHEKGRRHTLLASLKHVYWRRPHWFEWAVYVAVLAANLLGTSSDYLLAAGGVALAFLLLRVHEFGNHYVENRWPGDERKQEHLANIHIAALLLLIFSGFIKAFIESLISEPVETFKFVAMAIAFIAWCYPVMWSLDRVFKPWMARTQDKIVPGFCFVMLCGVWFFVSMASLLYFTGKLSA